MIHTFASISSFCLSIIFVLFDEWNRQPTCVLCECFSWSYSIHLSIKWNPFEYRTSFFLLLLLLLHLIIPCSLVDLKFKFYVHPTTRRLNISFGCVVVVFIIQNYGAVKHKVLSDSNWNIMRRLSGPGATRFAGKTFSFGFRDVCVFSSLSFYWGLLSSKTNEYFDRSIRRNSVLFRVD